MFSFLSDSSEIFGLTSITDLKVFEGGGGGGSRRVVSGAAFEIVSRQEPKRSRP